MDRPGSEGHSMAIVALATGLREANLVELSWSQIDLDRGTAWIYGDKAKGKEDIHVSLSDAAMSVLRRQIGKHPERVFTYRGKPIGLANTHVQHGTPLYDLQEMGGWKPKKMVLRYAHFAPANLAKHAQVVGRLLEGANLAQPTNELGALLEVTPCKAWLPEQGSNLRPAD